MLLNLAPATFKNFHQRLAFCGFGDLANRTPRMSWPPTTPAKKNRSLPSCWGKMFRKTTPPSCVVWLPVPHPPFIPKTPPGVSLVSSRSPPWRSSPLALLDLRVALVLATAFFQHLAHENLGKVADQEIFDLEKLDGNLFFPAIFSCANFFLTPKKWQMFHDNLECQEG